MSKKDCFRLFFVAIAVILSTLNVNAQVETPQDTLSGYFDDLMRSDTLTTADADSIALILMKYDADSAAKAIVGDADQMLDIMNDVGDIPYFDKYNYPSGYIPEFPDSVYAKRIEELAANTTMELTFNKHVKSFIDVYAVQKRDKTSRILGLADIYFPLFEETLDKYGMPLELKYLAVVESALNPTAGSHAGAKGLWQFMYGTGKMYKLNVTTMVDDRFDPVMATDAACRHLRDLYNTFGDWFLALAAYNSGAGNVNKAIRRAGGIKNYWAVWPFLPRETRGYVPAFIAVNYIMNYYREHNIQPLDPGIMMDGIDTVLVHEPLAFEQVNEMLGVPMEDLKFFNPQYKVGIIPVKNGKTMVLRLPGQYVNAFIDNEKALYSFKTKKGIDKEKLQEEIKKVSDRSVHIVKKGETLGAIARKYHISVKQLKQWNNLKSDRISINQKLIVYSSGAPMAKGSQSSNEPATTTSGGYVIYTVKSGDTLTAIAKKFSVKVDQLRKLNNLNNKSVLKIGQKLKIKKK